MVFIITTLSIGFLSGLIITGTYNYYNYLQDEKRKDKAFEELIKAIYDVNDRKFYKMLQDEEAKIKDSEKDRTIIATK
jgi:hypothetical protein